MLAENEITGCVFQVPGTWSKEYLKSKNLKRIENKDLVATNETGDPNKILVYRAHGGWGDMICLIEAVKTAKELYAGKGKTVYLSIPERYKLFLNDELKKHYIPFKTGITDTLADYDIKFGKLYNAFCPCAVYEYETQNKPIESRIEIFAEFLGVEVKKPEQSFSSKFGKKYLKKKGINGPLIGFAVKSAAISKDWSISYFWELARLFINAGYKVLIIDLEEIASPYEGIYSIHGLSMKEVGSILTQVELLVTPDSGMMHMAGAMDVPFIGLFGPTNGKLTTKHYTSGVYIQGKPDTDNKSCDYPCNFSEEDNKYYCNHRIGDCMNNIQPDAVFQASMELLRKY